MTALVFLINTFLEWQYGHIANDSCEYGQCKQAAN